ncbi:MAG TPA: NAD+ synthase [Prolixibacteraceae bacterium]|nr:NAD+ synthase [Prolixibacteraceae bacterium]HRV90131.1 NAD+ synthase [Prolixibacteraceae bacterium]
MKIALVQLNYRIGDFDGNILKITESIERARREGAELAVFSELSVTGYYPQDLLERQEFIAAAQAATEKIAGHCHGIAALVGAPVLNEGERGKKLYNAALYLADGKVKDLFCKSLLPTYDVFDEYRHFEPNKSFHLLEAGGEKIAVTICEDLWDEQPVQYEFGKDKLYQCSPMEELAKLQPGLIVNLSASPFSVDQEAWRKEILTRKARQYGLPLVYVNQTGAQAELIFDGGSLFIGPDGKILREMAYFREDFLIIDTACSQEATFQPGAGKIGKMEQALLLGIRDYFAKTGFQRATLGLSGGIDSAVVAVLAVRALGPENVRVLLMPSRYSSSHSVDDAVTLAQNLGIRYDNIPIQASVDSIYRDMAPLFGDLPHDITEENVQARIRGVLLMALSNKFGCLLLNTSNKSECAVGYGTLYGDMNGSLAVLGDLYKTEVYALARWINRHEEIIPHHSIIKPPSAELRPGQKDSDSLPEYPILDDILYQYIELNFSPEEIAASGFDLPLVNKVIRMVNLNEYKRFQAAPILRVSAKAFGFGRRIPLVARF